MNKAVRFGQNWGLMPFGVVVGSVMPATYMRGSRESYFGEPNIARYAWAQNEALISSAGLAPTA